MSKYINELRSEQSFERRSTHESVLRGIRYSFQDHLNVSSELLSIEITLAQMSGFLESF